MSSVNRVPLTVKGAEHIRKKLDELISVERPRIIQAIATARALGDLKENAEYQEAKREQSLIEGQIESLKAKIGNAQIIDVTKIPNDGRVIFGATVRLVSGDDDSKVSYQIVGEDEADIKHSKISFNSPIARAMIGKSEGDSVEVVTPKGIVEYFIDKVEYV